MRFQQPMERSVHNWSRRASLMPSTTPIPSARITATQTRTRIQTRFCSASACKYTQFQYNLVMDRQWDHGPCGAFHSTLSFPRGNFTKFGHNYGGVAGYGCCLDLETGAVVQNHDQLGALLPGGKSIFKLAYNCTDSTLLDIQKQDPMYNAEICPVFETEDSSTGLTFGPRPDMQQEENCAEGNDMFRKFPYEILWSILLHLSFKDVFNLRRSSRVFRRMLLPEVY